MLLLLLFLLLQAPYWETKPAPDWSNREVLAVLQQSPWAAETVVVQSQPGDEPLNAYLASAEPCAKAEDELFNRKKTGADPLGQEYRDWKRENTGKYVILAIPLPNAKGFSETEEIQSLEKSTLSADKRKLKLAIHFPPSSTDPTLRLAFPKPVGAVKKLHFSIYIPGVHGPDREVDFETAKLTFQGKSSY